MLLSILIYRNVLIGKFWMILVKLTFILKFAIIHLLIQFVNFINHFLF